MAIVRHTRMSPKETSAGTGLTPEQIAEVREAAKRPYTYDPDCPLLTAEQLAEFRPVHFDSMEERAQAMREAGLADPSELAREQIAAAV